MADDIEDVPPESIELRRFDLHSVWRVLLWGASAAMAVAIVAGTAFSDLGAERLQQTVAALFEPANPDTQQPQVNQQATQQLAQPLPPLVTPPQLAELQNQTRDLTQTVRDLTAERDRMKTRLASLEQNFDDITGAIKKQTAQSAQIAAQLSMQTTTKEQTRQAASPPPVISAPQTVAAIPSPSATTTAAPDTPVTTAIPSSPAVEASPPITGPIPLPPMRTAALETDNRELGVDLGGAASLDQLRAYWTGLKANIGPDIVGLTPSYVARQRQSGGTDYRLVLGPLPNSAAALRLCAKLVTSRINCRAGTFSVQRLAERPTPEPQRATEQLPAAPRDSILSR
jgi:hypothetical protein